MMKICFFLNILMLLSLAGRTQSIKDSVNKKTTPFNFASPVFNSTTFTKPLPANYYYNHLGFFCKEEIQIQKATKLPLKIRVGAVNDCDRLEGKSF